MVRKNNIGLLETGVPVPALSQNDYLVDKHTHTHTTEYHITHLQDEGSSVDEN